MSGDEGKEPKSGGTLERYFIPKKRSIVQASPPDNIQETKRDRVSNLDGDSNTELLNRILNNMERYQEEMKKEIGSLREELRSEREEHARERTLLRGEINGIKEEMNYYKRRVERLEARERENNLIVRGLCEHDNENTKEAVTVFFRDQLKVVDIPLREAHRLGKREGARDRPIMVTLWNREDKSLIFRNTRTLRGTSYFVHNDLSREARERKQRNLRMIKKLREQNKDNVVMLRADKIYLNGRYYVLEYDHANEEDKLRLITDSKNGGDSQPRVEEVNLI